MSENVAEETTVLETKPRIDWLIFLPSLLVILSISAVLILFPVEAASYVNLVKDWITTTFGWLFLLVGVGCIGFAGWLAFGPYGNVKLGEADEPPEYSNTHWIAMMFTAGIGAGLIVWGFAEPIYYLQTPPFGIEPHSNESIHWAHMYPLFHWGVVPWAMYVVPAIPIAYLLYVKRSPTLRVSSACDAALPKSSRGGFKTLIDILIIFGIIGGNATSLGLGIPLVSAMVSEFLSIQDTVHVKLGLLGAWTVLFSYSVFRGLEKGIKMLADINMVLAVIGILFILFAGPTLFILNLTTNSLGLMLQNMPSMVFWTDPIEKGGFPEAWTIFYWTWWLAFAAYVGLFIARISRGRTIRQMIVGVIGWGSLGTWLFLGITGGYALHLQHSGLLPVSDILTEQGQFALVAIILGSLPLGKAVIGLFIILSVVFYATNVDSAAYVLASVCSKNLRSDQEPGRINRLVWALLMASFTAGLVVTGGLSTVQAATIITALPLVPVILLMCISLVKWLEQDFGQAIKNQQLSRESRK